jgi:mono/diheme cytochrome c family protein
MERCTACHGSDGSGPPNILGTSAEDLETELTTADSHTTGGLRECLDEQDFADLEAFLGQ